MTAQGSFDFSLTGNNGFSLSNGEEYATDVVEGTYTIAENALDGWASPSISCEYDNESVGVFVPPNSETVTVDAGDTVVCTFANTQLGKIIIQKVTEPDQNDEEAGQAFDFQTSYEENEIVLSNNNSLLLGLFFVGKLF